MKNKSIILVVLIIILSVGLGCRFIQDATTGGSSNANTSNPTNTSTNTNTIGKIGVPECDELFDYMAEQQNSPDDNFVTKKAKEFVFDEIRKQIKQNIEENANDTQSIAQACKEARAQLEKNKTEPEQKPQQ
jgi:hypothetical protein